MKLRPGSSPQPRLEPKEKLAVLMDEMDRTIVDVRSVLTRLSSKIDRDHNA